MPLDAALENRFEFKLEVGYLPKDIEFTLLLVKGIVAEVADRLLGIVNQLRHNSEAPIHISTRDTINIGRLLGAGISLFLALKTVVGSDLDKLESMLLENQLSGAKDIEIEDLSTSFGPM
jgi:hypothetical protein